MQEKINITRGEHIFACLSSVIFGMVICMFITDLCGINAPQLYKEMKHCHDEQANNKDMGECQLHAVFVSKKMATNKTINTQ